jgi:AraC-like DNA-binding protein
VGKLESSRGDLPTVTGFAVRQAVAALLERDVAIEPLLQRAGLSPKLGHNRIPALTQSRFLELAAEALNDPVFGLHLAEKTNPRAAGLLFYVASAAKDVAEALSLFSRYFRIANEAVRLKITQTAQEAAVEIDFFADERDNNRQNREFGIALFVKALREVAGRKISPISVSFAHFRNSDLPKFKSFYRCPVEFGAAHDQLLFSSEMLAAPLITEDHYLLETLRPICDEAAEQRRTPKHTLRAIVEDLMQRMLPHGKAKRQTIAQALLMSERTLTRKLAQEGTSFDKVLDEVRRSLALQYINEREISFSQISWLLGYEGATSFNHAFRRWTGKSPAEMRKEAGSA